MGFRFRRSIKLLAGLRKNFAKLGRGAAPEEAGSDTAVDAPEAKPTWRERLGSRLMRRYASRWTKEEEALLKSLGFDLEVFDRIASEGLAMAGEGERAHRYVYARFSEAADEINRLLADGIHQHRKVPATVERVNPATLDKAGAARWRTIYRGVDDGVPEAMAAELDRVLDTIDYFVETGVEYALTEDGRRLELTIGLPTLMAMPRRHFAAVKSQSALKGKFKSSREQLREHSTYIHGVALRIAGSAFAALPTLDEVICRGSALDGATVGPAAFSREEWGRIRFNQVDPTAVFAAARKPAPAPVAEEAIEEVEVDTVRVKPPGSRSAPSPAHMRAWPSPTRAGVRARTSSTATVTMVTGSRPPRTLRSDTASSSEPPPPSVPVRESAVSQKSKTLMTSLALFSGCLGGHRFYAGRYRSGLLMLLTFGGFGIWALFDILQVLRGKFVDGKGLPIVGNAKEQERMRAKMEKGYR